ncbi:MAG: D-2-hydroxyacid dehydrogenase family protein [Betaproteobacteria bacterium]|nr:D-2-hydroxyacid dehydrogenase family protein [Betaproteobacteria bacterium]
MKLAILDDYQQLALKSADWDRLRKRGVEVSVFHEAFGSREDATAKLAPFEVLVLMRERTPLPRELIDKLPKLKFMALTGLRSASLDLAACSARKIPVSNTRAGTTSAVTAEFCFLLILAAARDFARGERNMRMGHWHEGIAGGIVLEGKRLGLLGLGKLGSRVAGYAKAFGMEVVAWSQNLTQEKAAALGARYVDKQELLKTSDFVSIQLVLSDRTRGLIGAADLALMKPAAILINTSRGPIVDEAAMLAALRSGKLAHAALDVYGIEPLPKDHPLRSMDNVTLAPHLGYVSEDVYRTFWSDCVENVESWLDGKPVRVLNPESLS